MNSPAGPFFVAPHAESSAGVDYLGLRAINLSMMATLFPGINNVVSMVRPFSLIAWVCWKYAIAVDASGKPASNVSFKKFREKVEVLFVWSHVQAGDAAGLAGVQQHDNGRPYLNFQFAEFRRTASLLDAVQYGPSLKSSNGLEFIFSRGRVFQGDPVRSGSRRGPRCIPSGKHHARGLYLFVLRGRLSIRTRAAGGYCRRMERRRCQ